MSPFSLAPVALRDIEEILAWSQERFGVRARLRYEALLEHAILDVAEEPERIESRARPEIGPSVRTYHLSHSRNRIGRSEVRIRRPRHFLLYRVSSDRVEIGRILHESMDLARHVPTDDTPKGPRARKK